MSGTASSRHPSPLDPGVISVEGFNVRYMTPESLAAASGVAARAVGHHRRPLVHLARRTCCPPRARSRRADADLVLLVKPQFEVGRTAVKGGLVTDAALRADAVAGVLWAAWDAGLGTLRRRLLPDRRDARQHRVHRAPRAGTREQSDRMVEHREPTGGEPMTHAETNAERSILVVAHAQRDDTVIAAERVVGALRAAGARPVLAADDRDELAAVRPVARRCRDCSTTCRSADIELAIVLGGDGTILRAAELVRDGTAPVLGINMGHVGFLAEIERDDMDDAVRRVIDARLRRRGAARAAGAGEGRRRRGRLRDVGAERGDRREGQPRAHARGRHRGRRAPAVDVRLRRRRRLDAHRVDRLQLLRRRTGDLAHGRGDRGRAAVGARPVREAARRRARARASRSSCSSARTTAASCGATDVARTICRPGARVVVRRSERPVRLARLHPAAFTDRLVRKFRLPVDGLARARADRTVMQP